MSTWLGEDATPETVAAFFAAAAALWRAAPWRQVPDAAALLSLRCDVLMLDDVLSVSGEGERALRLFPDFAEHEEFERLRAAGSGQEGEPPTCLEIAFVAADALGRSLREEIERHGWEIAAEEAWPLLRITTHRRRLAPPRAIELETAEAVARAVAAALAEPGPLRAALEGGEPFSRELEVICAGEPANVTIGAPVPPPPERSLSLTELIARLGGDRPARGGASARLDVFDLWALETELLRRFALASEPRPTRGALAFLRHTFELARDRFGRGVTEIDPDELGQILLEELPREVDVAPSDAGRVVEINRDLFRFLECEAALSRAGGCAASLDAGTVTRLEQALADPDGYGPEKAARMAVLAAGLDPDSDEGEMAWMQAFEQALIDRGELDRYGPFGFPDELPPQRQRTPAEQKARKKKRKAARKARRRNR